MLRFSRENGTDLTPELEREIAQLDSILKQLALPPVSDIPSVLVSDNVPPVRDESLTEGEPNDVSTAVPSRSSTELILHVHGELSKAITPATALSLKTSEPPPGRHTFLGGMPLVVKAAAVAALLCAIGFVTSAGFIGAKAARVTAVEKAKEAGKTGETSKPPVSEGEKK